MASKGIAFIFTFDYDGPIKILQELLPRDIIGWVKKGAGTAAYRLQEMAREDLDRLIYNTPETPNYIRTGTLRRATYAARPGANHSMDHDAAFGGQDLGVSLPAAGGIVKITADEGEVEIGSWANWSEHVIEGHGLGARIPKRFLDRVEEEASGVLEEETILAINASIESRMMT